MLLMEYLMIKFGLNQKMIRKKMWSRNHVWCLKNVLDLSCQF